jgi:pimeloyl-ACP methyl ester carboxylesterase
LNTLLIALFIIIFSLIFIYFYFAFKLLNPNKIRIPEGGNLADLKNGKLYYRWFSPEKENGEILVLVHGFSTPSVVWEGVLPYLLEEGFKVLVYDHYGRGYSSRPKVKYTKDLFVDSLDELIEHQEISQKINLVGYSMGGPIVAGYAEKHSEKVRSASFIAPAGYMSLSVPWYQKLFYRFLTMPIIRQFIGVVAPSIFYGGNATLTLSTLEDEQHVPQERLNEIYREQMKYEGFTRSLLSTIKNFNLFQDKSSFKDIGNSEIPCSVIWGTSDETVSFDGHNEMQKDFNNLFSTVIENGFHDITYSMPTKVAKHLLSFLKQL